MPPDRASRIEALFRPLRAERRAAFIPFIMAGDPSLPATIRLAETLGRSGADLIELGIPFSDPIADGPTIQHAAERALERGASLRGILEALPKIRERAGVPLVLMTYLNPALKLGLSAFARSARLGGADGIILTDLPVEEAGEARAAFDGEGIDLIGLAAPTSGARRLRLIAKTSRGFVYCITRTGVTGARSALPADLRSLAAAVRAATEKPIVLGFGISSPEHAREAAALADGVVVGSAIVDRIERAGDDEERMHRDVGGLATEISRALGRAPASHRGRRNLGAASSR